ncbi:MAG: iron-containing alcohol dehydrogenase, partial [Candidatus Cloacimonetes bacterium]|nr:iron-containing alcohol dehydrogenase [Candidatus Cloacimonadota bacterium]
MMQKALFPGQYLQGAGALYELPLLVKKYGSKALMLASPSVIKAILPGMSKEFASELLVIEQFGGECSQPELSRIFKQVRSSDIDVMIGMGGGKTIDTAKIVADWAGIPVIVVPTIASTDAPCSGCAVTYSPEGVFETVLYQKRNPAVVLVDLNIIAAAPVRFLISGMGDALATWFEARSCECTKSLNE